jgi:uncharacterized protein (DUF4415 family)
LTGVPRPWTEGKTRITIRLDEDVLAWFRAQVNAAGGGNYQSLINAALREHITRKQEPLEATQMVANCPSAMNVV